jgi:hypothetical protein
MTKNGHVHDLDLLKKELSNKNSAKKSPNTQEIEFCKHPRLRFYKKHNLPRKLFLFNKETQVEIFFESVFGKYNCSGNQSVIAGVCTLT